MHICQGSFIEGLNNQSVAQFKRKDNSQADIHHFVIYRPVHSFNTSVPVRVCLDFYIVFHRCHSLFSGIFFDSRQYIRKQRSDGWKCLLFRIIRMLTHADIVLGYFFVGHFPHVFPWIFLLHRCTVWACGFFGREILVMG